MKLTKEQREEILRYLDRKDNKPLPDKYRFLLFEDKREVELVWNGKQQEVCDAVLPFQTIEQVDEPRDKEAIKDQQALFGVEGRQLAGWSNKLIWGDNKLILSSLARGPMRDQIEAEGGIKLIYIDPPFDVGADFKMNISVNGEDYTKEPGAIEEFAYRDTWGKGSDSYIAMMYERLKLMHQLLAEDGSIYVHCDWRVNSYLRLILDEVFGKENFRNEIVWCYSGGGVPKKDFPRKHDAILRYSKSEQRVFYIEYKEYKENTQQVGKHSTLSGGKEINLDRGTPVTDWWVDVPTVTGWAKNTNYPTQKPLALLQRIIKASSNKDDLIADFFCGSGTTAVAAEGLGRKWLCGDLGKFAVHTTRKRMIETQRDLKSENQSYRSFEILNLGKYERQYYIGVNSDLSREDQKKQLDAKGKEYKELILKAYGATALPESPVFDGSKKGRMVTVGPINFPVGRAFMEKLIGDCRQQRMTRLDVLGFDFEMGLCPEIRNRAMEQGVDLQLKYIPRDVFDKRILEKNDVIFHDMAHIEVKVHRRPHKKDNTTDIQVELINFAVYYSQESVKAIEQKMANGQTRIAMEGGKIVKVSKNEQGVSKSTPLTKHWKDWVDYWSVDFNFESKPETVRIRDEKTGEIRDEKTGDFIFENEWQTFRTREQNQLELKTDYRNIETGKRLKIAVKVVDIFGNDTMHIEKIVV